MALAAGLLLVVGGASYFAATTIRPGTPAKPVEVADAATRRALDAGASSSPPTDQQSGRPGPERPGPERLASKVDARSTTTEAPAATGATPSAALAANDSPAPEGRGDARGSSQAAGASQVATAGAEALSDDAGLDDARAVELAKQGRLVIRLRAPDPFVLSHPSVIADRVRHSSSSMMWRLGDEAPSQLASMLHAASSPVPERTAPISAPSAPVVASDELGKDMFGPPAPAALRPATAFTPMPAPTVYLVQTKLDAAAIEGLRRALAPYGEATLEESAQPLPLDDSLNPAAVVWWSQPPSGWAWWASVPVVIDQQP
jgi:hypothetical protein